MEKIESNLEKNNYKPIHIYDEMISGYHVNHKKLNPVSSLTGDKYCATSDVFELFRPKL